MFKSPEALSPDKHLSLKLSTVPDYRFCAGEIVCPVVSGEMWQIAREYIMVFPQQDHELPLALLGTQPGVNMYLGDGNPPWWGRYIPAHFRRYPFVAAPAASKPDDTTADQRFTVCIDASAPQFSTLGGQPLFNPNGSGTELLVNVQNTLLSLQQDFNITAALVKQIADAGLLVDQGLTIKPDKRDPVTLQGFRVIDQNKFRQADPELLAPLMKTRALDLIYAHICSLSNLHDGLLAKKPLDTPSQPKTSQIDVEELFSSKNDIIRFN